MSTTVERTKETNDLGYEVIDATTLKPLGDQLVVAWELCQEHIKVGKFILSRPDTHKKMHYTGKVIAVGKDLNPSVKVGCRIAFDQFSDPNKYWDETLGRVALLKESRQGQLFLVVSPRTKVEGSEPEYNFDE